MHKAKSRKPTWKKKTTQRKINGVNRKKNRKQIIRETETMNIEQENNNRRASSNNTAVVAVCYVNNG